MPDDPSEDTSYQPESQDTVEPAPTPSTGIAAFVSWSKQQTSDGQARANTFLAQHRDHFVVDVGGRIYVRDKEAAGSIIGSAIAFRLFLFLVPLVLFVVGLAGFFAGRITAENLNDAGGFSGGLADEIEGALAQSGQARWVAVSLGLVGIATTGRTLSKALVATSCLVWRLPLTSKASIRVLGGIIGTLSTMGLVAAVVNRIRDRLGVGAAGASFLGAMVIYLVAWLVVFALLPRSTSDPGALLPGAAFLAVTLAAMQAVSQLYIPGRLSHASALYGGIGTTIVALGWFFIFGRALVLAMVINTVIWERFGSISQLVLSLPVIRIIPRKSSWIRKFFDLDEGDPET